MPDLTTEYYWHCASVEAFHKVVESSSSDKTYTVRRDLHSHKYTDEVEFDWSCTCPSYEYRCGPNPKQDRYCKHIKAVRDSDAYCGWMQGTDGGTPDYDDEGMAHCPECGRKAISQGYDV